MEVKNICVVSAFFPPHIGGVERYAHYLSMHLSKTGYKVCVVTLNTENQKEFEECEFYSIIRLPYLNFLGGRYPFPKFNKKFYQLLSLMKDFKPDLFILNQRFYVISYLFSYIAELMKKPSFLIEHVTGHFTVGNKIFDFVGHIYEHLITKATKNKVTKFYGVSEACNLWLKHFKIKSSGIIYNGADINIQIDESYNFRQDKKLDSETFIVFFAGRLIQEKGIDELVDAFKIFNKKNPKSLLYVAGEGPLLEKFQKPNEENSSVVFPGKVEHSDLMNILNNSDVVVIPSYYPEGLPTLILEAGVLGKPVISTDRGGAKEIITNDDLGVVIKQKSVEDIEKALELIHFDNGYSKKISKNLQQRIFEKFSWEVIVLNLKKEIDLLIYLKKN